jgi:hypothetical protein
LVSRKSIPFTCEAGLSCRGRMKLNATFIERRYSNAIHESRG